MQMAKVTAPNLEDTKATASIPEDKQVVYYQSPTPQSEGLIRIPGDVEQYTTAAARTTFTCFELLTKSWCIANWRILYPIMVFADYFLLV